MGSMEIEDKYRALAAKVLRLSRNSIIITMRFLDSSLSKLLDIDNPSSREFKSNGKEFYYDPVLLLERVRRDKNYAARLYLHMILHFIFAHPYGMSKITDAEHRELFSLAADIAVENVIMDMNIEGFSLLDDDKRRDQIRVLKKYNSKITAQTIYRYFLVNGLSLEGKQRIKELFVFDSHALWVSEEMTISLKEWQKLSERIKTEIKSFSGDSSKSEGLSENLEEATKDQYNYNDILQAFMVNAENMSVNDDEFDYIYYTYGMKLYENMPLIEPLEYRDENKIRDFCIVLDTSASCQGSIVRSFLKRTVGILKSSESFFKQVNIHIIQCDNIVQSDTVIRNQEEFDEFLKNGKLTGFGGTDFRPAFEYVNELIEKGEFEGLKGLIYFTDGYGTYPEYMPEYDSMFVFIDDDKNRPHLPPWAIKVVLSEDELKE